MENITTNPQESVDVSQQMETNVNNEEGSKEVDSTLKFRHERYCQAFFKHRGNGTQAYLEASQDENKVPTVTYETACVESSRLLRYPNILKRIQEVLKEKGFNDENIDNELLELIIQNDDKGNKLGAIREYNKLKQRITEKLEHSGKIENIVTKEQITELLKRNETNA